MVEGASPLDRESAGGESQLIPPDRLDLRLLSAIRRIIRMVDIDSRRLAADHQVTGPQLLCLRALVEEGQMTAKQIADAIHVSPSTLVGVLVRLEGRDLVSRERSTGDRRLVLVTPTEEGRKIAQEVPYPLQQGLAQALGALPKGKQKLVTEYLERVVDTLDTNGEADR